MKKQIIQYTLSLCLIALLWGTISHVAGQYYYFDSWTTNYPFQQWCSESVDVRINTETNPIWARAGLLRLSFDANHFSYSTSSLASTLQTNLFVASTQTFMMNTSPTASPSWMDPGVNSILQIDRYNSATNYMWSNGLYGTVLFTPKYSQNSYTWRLNIIYNGDTIRTSLSKVGGINIIDPWHQENYLTWYYPILQAPCVADTTPPVAVLNVPTWGTKKSHLSGIALDLTENVWVNGASVPYVWTGGWVWTGNVWGISNQYGINLSTFTLQVSGNGTTRQFGGSLFSPAGSLSAVPSALTWQFLDKNYSINITSSELFYYGIEKPITISWSVKDRNNLITTFTRTVNVPVWPTLIPWSRNPDTWSDGVLAGQPITVGIQDDWAGVNSGSIVITLQGIWWTEYGPYTFSWNALSFSWIRGSANQPDYYVTVANHIPFPTSWTIQVSVYAQDMEGNIDTIDDYTFSTKPSCIDLGCCEQNYLQTGTNSPVPYNGNILNISWWIDPSFVFDGNTWTVDCHMENQWMDIFKWVEESTWTATHISFFDLPNLILSWDNVRAILSWKTLYLQRIYIPPISTGCVGSCWGGWGGIHLVIDDCTLPSTLACSNTEWTDESDSFYDNTCCAPDEWHGAADCDITDPFWYSQEISEAYQRWFDLNITNKCPIEDAQLDEPLLRKDLAKMMTLFMIQIAGIYPDTHKAWCDAFSDSGSIADEMNFYTKTACQLYVMGLHQDGKTPKAAFDPYDPVPRTQLGTVLSRLIYGDQYNVYSGEETQFKRYEKHLRALYEANIMTKINNPFIIETRARALLMLKRTDDEHLIETYRLAAPAHNGALSLLENVR